MGKLTNINATDSTLPVLSYLLAKNGKSTKFIRDVNNTLTVDGISDASLKSILDGIGLGDEQIVQRIIRFNIPAEIYTYDNASPSKEELKGFATKSVLHISDALRTHVLTAGEYTTSEALGFADKAAIAAKIVANTASVEEEAQVQAEANARGKSETVAQLATLQTTKAEALRTRRGIIDGGSKKARDAVTSATTLQQIRLAFYGFVEDVTEALENDGL